ncbi:MAG: ABC transporter ATP-binding protein [Gammaproteobacteria bacterium]|nr:ABC transporter ATP-binding protein [Gammaproteobacteria bacterium]
MASVDINPFEDSESKSILEPLSLLPRTISFVVRATPIYFLLSNTLGLVQAGLAALLLWLAKVVVDRVVESLGSEIDWSYVLFPMIAIIVCRLIQSAFSASFQIINFMMSEKIENKANTLLLNKAAKLDLVFYESPQYYDRLYQARENIGSLQMVIEELMVLVAQLLTLVAMFGLLSVLHPFAFLILIATVSPRILVEGYTSKRQFELEIELTRNGRIRHYFNRLLTEREYVKEVKVFGLGSYLMSKFLQLRDVVVTALLKLNIHFVKVQVLFDMLGYLGLCLVWVYAVYRAGQGELTIGDLFMIFGAAQSSKDALEAWFAQCGGVFGAFLSLSRFFELVDLDPRSVPGALEMNRTGPRASLPERLKKGIEFRNVSFHYPGTDLEVLKEISFSIPANSKLAIVGENGAGKTTLVKLLARFYDPVDGSICLDGKDYRDHDLQELRKGITVIFQDFARYDLSVADNIGVGRVDFLTDRQRIEQSARNGGAHQMAMKLPSQYDTVLGRTFEEGVDLSGGEWQNVAISRAYMSDAQLFILDEPTAALDAFKEAEVFDRFSHLTQGRTVVLVSHRFSTVRMADLICVIEDGRVIEYGTHEELVRLNGKYRRMFDAQAERYR